MNIKNLLNGLSFGTKQQVGIMSVVPLLGEDTKVPIASFDDVKFDGTYTYGVMLFSNASDKPFIIPTGYDVITEQKAQDHALPFATLIKPKNYCQKVETACCIQHTQGGYIDGSILKEKASILPLYIRKGHFEKCLTGRSGELRIPTDRWEFNFGRLWPLIAEFQGKLINDRTENLVLFFNKFMNQLTHFNAEFEVVPNQRGAIIMLNDKIIGIEIVPTHAYWKTIWDGLIRDCYGTEVLRLTMQNLIKEFQVSEEMALNLDDCKTLEEIKQCLADHSRRQLKTVQDKVNEILGKEIMPIKDNHLVLQNSSNGLKYDIFRVKGESIYGELYTSGSEIVYCSLIA